MSTTVDLEKQLPNISDASIPEAWGAGRLGVWLAGVLGGSPSCELKLLCDGLNLNYHHARFLGGSPSSELKLLREGLNLKLGLPPRKGS